VTAAIAFDERTGRLRVDQATFDSLVAWAARGADAPPGPDLAALRDAGAVGPGTAHPALAPGLLAVTEPVCRLSIRLTDERGRTSAGDGWIRSDAASLLLDLPGGMRDFLTVHPSFLPAAIARVVRLGPRPRVRSGPVRVPAAELGSGAWRVWRAEMTWKGPGVRRREVHVADGREGLRLVEPDGEEAVLRPTTPTEVWRLLIRLLPDTAELG
jgi:hypothetical protein